MRWSELEEGDVFYADDGPVYLALSASYLGEYGWVTRVFNLERGVRSRLFTGVSEVMMSRWNVIKRQS